MYGFFESQRISKSSLHYVINLMEQGALSEATNPEAVKNFGTVYGFIILIAVSTKSCHVSPVHVFPSCFRSTLILYTHLCLGFLCGHFSSYFCTETCPFTFYACHTPCPSYRSWLDHQSNIWWGVQIVKMFNTQYP